MDRSEKYWMKNAREISNLCLSRISYCYRVKIIGKGFIFSFLNVSELIRGLTRARNLRKKCIYMYCKTSLSRLDFWFILISFNFFCPKSKLLNSGCGLSASVAYAPVFKVFNVCVFISLNSVRRFTAEQAGGAEKYTFSWKPCTPFTLPSPDGCEDVLVSLFYRSRLKLEEWEWSDSDSKTELAQWWEHLPFTNVARVQFPDPPLYVSWVSWV